MARITGINVPTNKRVLIALTYVHGIGLNSSINICKKVGVDENKRINNLSEMSSRVKLDRYYFKNWSLFFDFKIFFKTLFKMIKFNLS